MRLSAPGLFRTTTFRLALAQAIVFLLFSSALLTYVYFTTAGELQREAHNSAAQEYDRLAEIYAEGGVRALNQEVIERAAASGPFLYMLADPTGEAISGDFSALPQIPESAAERTVFEYEVLEEGDKIARKRARGRVGRMRDGAILLVARDMGEATGMVTRISNAVWTAAVASLGLSLVGGLLASRQAARRAEALSRTAQDVMRGDLARRAPVAGLGDEFDHLAEDLNAMWERIEKLVHSIRTAGDAIAHDLRTPLSRLRQRVEGALEAEPSSEADREALRRALEEIDQVLATFNAVLRLSRLQSAAGLKFERVDLTAMVADLAEFYAPLAEEGGVVFSARVAAGLAVRGEGNLIAQALSNLIENAIKYAPAPGRMEVSAQRLPDGRVELRVADNGPGIPEAERERVVERFVRLEAARSSPGAGLGLSLVAAIADVHRAELVLSEGLSGPHGPGLSAALVMPAMPARG